MKMHRLAYFLDALGNSSAMDYRLKAIQSEEAWKNAGKRPGLEIWRIENFNVKPWPKNQYGIYIYILCFSITKNFSFRKFLYG